MAEGIDYAWYNPGVTLSKARQIRDAGKEFACRYVSPDRTGKNMTPSEVRNLAAAGVSTVTNFEWQVGQPERGYHQGKADASLALQQAKACGMPDGRPIYFSIDYDTSVGPNIRGYFKGVNEVLGKDARFLLRSGAYGSYRVVKQLHEEGLIGWVWQTYAWSYLRFYARSHIYQYSNNHTLAGISVDYNKGFGDYGGWKPGERVEPNDLQFLTKREKWAVLKHRRAVAQKNSGRIAYWRGELSLLMRAIRVVNGGVPSRGSKAHRYERYRALRDERGKE